MWLDQKLDGPFRFLGNVNESQPCVASQGVLSSVAQDIDVAFAKLRVVEVVQLSNALAKGDGGVVLHQVSAMQLVTQWGVFEGEKERAFALGVDVAVVNDILNGLNQHRHRPLGFFPGPRAVVQRPLSELNQMGDHAGVHETRIRQQNAMAWIFLNPVVTLRESLAQRAQQRWMFLAGHVGQFLDE